MSRPLVLMYNIGNPKATKIRVLCMKLHIGFKDVPAPAWHQPIGALAGVLPESTNPSESPATFEDEMLVMCNMNGVMLNAFLHGFRADKIPPVSLKAILTPTNAGWNALQLHDELVKEREAIQRGAAQK